MFTSMSACDLVNISISQIEDYVKDTINSLKKAITPPLAMCLCFVQGITLTASSACVFVCSTTTGSTSDAKNIIVWDWHTGGGILDIGWSGTSASTWKYDYNSSTFSKRFLKSLAQLDTLIHSAEPLPVEV